MTFRLSAYYFFYFAFVGVFSPYFGIYLQSQSFSAFHIGLLMSQMQLMRLIGPFVWGTLADRGWSRTGIIRWSAFFSLVGFSVFFWAKSIQTLLVAMAVLAFFWSATLPIIETLTFDHLQDQPGRYGRIRMWGSIGFIVAVMLLGWLLDYIDVSNVLWATILVLGGILGMSFLIPHTPLHYNHLQSAPERTFKETSFTQTLKTPRVQAVLLSCMAMSAAHGALYVFYSIHLSEHGYSKTMIGLLWSLGVIAEIGVFMVMPSLIKRWSLRQILLACYLVAIVRFWVIGWYADVLFLAVVAQVTHGLTFGAHHAASIGAINQWFSKQHQSRGQAVYSSLSFGAGGLIGTLLSGYLWEHYSGGITYSTSAIFALIGAIIIWKWLHETETTTSHTHP